MTKHTARIHAKKHYLFSVRCESHEVHEIMKQEWRRESSRGKGGVVLQQSLIAYIHMLRVGNAEWRPPQERSSTRRLHYYCPNLPHARNRPNIFVEKKRNATTERWRYLLVFNENRQTFSSTTWKAGLVDFLYGLLLWPMAPPWQGSPWAVKPSSFAYWKT